MEKMIPNYIKFVLNTLMNANFEAYLVGGCVRDFLLGQEIQDFDITTSALPEEVIDLFQDYDQFHTGLKHGTVSLVISGEVVEITTFRLDSTYSDARHPDAVFFTRSLQEDLARRDFTINSIAYGLSEGFVDYFGGRADLQQQMIRAIGAPDRRFAEDALRILRGVRFAAALGFTIEANTYESMVQNAPALSRISAERKAIELTKALLGKNIRAALLDYTPIFAQMIPELALMKGFAQNNVHHIYDILTHTAVCIEGCPQDKELRLAALFHDTGKVYTYTVEKGVGHFYGHSAVSADIARRVLNDLKFDNNTKHNVLQLVKNHDRQIEATTKSVRRALNKMGDTLFFKLLALKRADNLAQNPDYGYRLEALEEIRGIAETLISEAQCFSLKNLAVDGRDMIALGFKGSEIGTALQTALQAVINEEIENNKDKILRYIQKN